MAKTRVRWSEDEIRVLTAIFFQAGFSIGDDDHTECRVIADALGRTPSSIDRQWRNIAAVRDERTHLNIGTLVKKAVRDYLDDPAAARAAAILAADKNGWQLHSLITQGATRDVLRAADDSDNSEFIRSSLLALAMQLEYKIFASGSHGYQAEGRLANTNGRAWDASIACTLSGSRSTSEVVDMKTTAREMRNAIQTDLDDLRVEQLPSGRLAASCIQRRQVGEEQFAVAIRVTERQKGT
jgi:hypothetical protein